MLDRGLSEAFDRNGGESFTVVNRPDYNINPGGGKSSARDVFSASRQLFAASGLRRAIFFRKKRQKSFKLTFAGSSLCYIKLENSEQMTPGKEIRFFDFSFLP